MVGVIRIVYLDFENVNDYNYILELVKPLIGGHEHEYWYRKMLCTIAEL